VSTSGYRARYYAPSRLVIRRQMELKRQHAAAERIRQARHKAALTIQVRYHPAVTRYQQHDLVRLWAWKVCCSPFTFKGRQNATVPVLYATPSHWSLCSCQGWVHRRRARLALQKRFAFQKERLRKERRQKLEQETSRKIQVHRTRSPSPHRVKLLSCLLPCGAPGMTAGGVASSDGLQADYPAVRASQGRHPHSARVAQALPVEGPADTVGRVVMVMMNLTVVTILMMVLIVVVR
jgi:hypothetical protein